MFYVYILKDKNNKIYIGYSADLQRRISEHLSGKVYSSARMSKPQLIYYEAYSSEELAKNRERKLKQRGSSKKGLLKRLRIK